MEAHKTSYSNLEQMLMYSTSHMCDGTHSVILILTVGEHVLFVCGYA